MTLTINPRRLVEPAQEPVSLVEMKLYLRVEHTAEDALIATLMTAAREAAERFLNISFISQRWQWETTPFCGSVALPFGPLRSVVEVATRAHDASDYTVMDSEQYWLRGDTLIFDAAPVVGTQVRVIYEAGFGDAAADVPATLRHAIMQHTAALYETRSAADVVDLQHIYASLREVRV